jgi:hypothetical protein
VAQRTFTVLVDWVDGDVFDTDEFIVVAKSAAEAKKTAHAMWSATNGAKYPSCRVEKVQILTQRMMRSFA